MAQTPRVAPGIDLGRAHVTGEVRRVTIDGRVLDGTELTIRVRHTGRVATFTVEAWNLTQSTWRAIESGAPVTIEVGWDEGPSATVCQGVVTAKRARVGGGGSNDYAYRIRGRSRGAAAVRERVSVTYRDATTHDIVRDLASRLDLDVGYLGPAPDADVPDAAPTIDGCWQCRETRRVRAWLDALADRAGRETGHQFEGSVDRGRLAFPPKRRATPDTRDHVELSTADSIRQLQPAGGEATHTNDTQPLRLLAFCHPLVTKHARLDIAHTAGGKAAIQGGADPDRATLRQRDGDEAVGAYRCVSYRHVSKTRNGAHATIAVVVPDTATYKYEA